MGRTAWEILTPNSNNTVHASDEAYAFPESEAALLPLSGRLISLAHLAVALLLGTAVVRALHMYSLHFLRALHMYSLHLLSCFVTASGSGASEVPECRCLRLE